MNHSTALEILESAIIDSKSLIYNDYMNEKLTLAQYNDCLHELQQAYELLFKKSYRKHIHLKKSKREFEIKDRDIKETLNAPYFKTTQQLALECLARHNKFMTVPIQELESSYANVIPFPQTIKNQMKKGI